MKHSDVFFLLEIINRLHKGQNCYASQLLVDWGSEEVDFLSKDVYEELAKKYQGEEWQEYYPKYEDIDTILNKGERLIK